MEKSNWIQIAPDTGPSSEALSMSSRSFVHKQLDRIGFSVIRKERPNGEWYYPVPFNSELSNAPYLYEIIFGRRENGTFVEVGAYDGYNYSNTWGLAVRGWKGFYVEPDPATFQKCVQNHKQHSNIVVSQCAVSDGTSSTIELTRGDLLTTGNAEQAAAYRSTRHFQDQITLETIKVDAVTLDQYLTSNGVPVGFEVLVVDVEGATSDVFEGFSLADWRPQMMIVELFDFHPTLNTTREKDRDVRRDILAQGYETIYKDSINTIFLRSDLV
jgi:FkbM family methyltransferase